MEDFNFLFGAYLAFFLFIFGFIWRMGSRQKKIQKELEYLRRTLSSYQVDNQLNQS